MGRADENIRSLHEMYAYCRENSIELTHKLRQYIVNDINQNGPINSENDFETILSNYSEDYEVDYKEENSHKQIAKKILKGFLIFATVAAVTYGGAKFVEYQNEYNDKYYKAYEYVMENLSDAKGARYMLGESFDDIVHDIVNGKLIIVDGNLVNPEDFNEYSGEIE